MSAAPHLSLNNWVSIGDDCPITLTLHTPASDNYPDTGAVFELVIGDDDHHTTIILNQKTLTTIIDRGTHLLTPR